MAQFASIEEFEEETGQTFDDASLRARARRALQSASAVLQSLTRQTLEYVEDDVAVLRGTWGADLELPERPVVDVSAVSIGQVPNDPLILTTTDYVAGNPLRLLTGGYWGGDQLVTVTYSHGFEEIPEDIKAATLFLAAQHMQSPDGTSESPGILYQGYVGDAAPFVTQVVNRYRKRTW